MLTVTQPPDSPFHSHFPTLINEVMFGSLNVKRSHVNPSLKVVLPSLSTAPLQYVQLNRFKWGSKDIGRLEEHFVVFTIKNFVTVSQLE